MMKIITLCGSLKFQEIFNDVQMILERHGHACFSIGHSEHDYLEPSKDEKEILDKVHYKKILHSDLVLVLDRNGYIGDSTRNEITFALVINKPVIYLRNTGYFHDKLNLLKNI